MVVLPSVITHNEEIFQQIPRESIHGSGYTIDKRGIVQFFRSILVSFFVIFPNSCHGEIMNPS